MSGQQPKKVTMPPAICHMPWVDKTYAIAGSVWVEVPHGTEISDVSKYMVFEGWKDSSVCAVAYEVVGSGGNKYKVQRSSEDTWSCSCMGYKFRGACKHIRKARDDNDASG